MLPLVNGAQEIRDEVFAEGTFHAAYEPQRAIRTRRWKYIRRFDDRPTPVLANVDDGPAKDAWVAGGWADPPAGVARAPDPVDGRDRRSAARRAGRLAAGGRVHEPDQVSAREPTRVTPLIGRPVRRRGAA